MKHRNRRGRAVKPTVGLESVERLEIRQMLSGESITADLNSPISGATRTYDAGYVDVRWTAELGVDPATIDVNDIVIVNDGRTLTVNNVTNLGGGVWRYKYAEVLHAATNGSALPVQVTFVAGQTRDVAGNANVTETESFLFDNRAPRVVSTAMNADQVNPTPSGPTTWAQQRSRMVSYTVTFSEPVQNITPANVQLINRGVNAPLAADTTVTLQASQLSLNATGTELTLRFPPSGPGSLADGVYLLRILPTVTDGANALDGNGDGIGGDAHIINGNLTNKFFVLRGDWNGSGGVNLLDYGTYATFNLKTVGPAGAPAYVDLNNSGGVNLLDYGIFSTNFGVSIKPVNDAPSLAGSPPVIELDNFNPDDTVDLTGLFSDVDDGVLSYQIVSNSPGLILADVAGTHLNLTGIDGKIGSGNLVIDAVDAGNKKVQATIHYNLNRPLEPVGSLPLPNVSVDEDSVNFHVDLKNYFFLQRPGHAPLTYHVQIDNANLLYSSVNLDQLQLHVVKNASGSANVTITPQTSQGGIAVNGTPVTFTVNVSSLPDAPVILDQTLSVPENSGNGAHVGLVDAFDPDPGQTVSYAITGGNTSNAFAINSTTGQITVANTTALDFETTPTFSLTVTVTDNGTPARSSSAVVTVSLTNVNEAPQPRPDIQPIRLDDARPSVTVSLDTLFVDVDSPSLSYEIVNSTLEHGSVTLSGSDLVITAPDGFDQNATVTIRANDGHGGIGEVTLEVVANRYEFVEVDKLLYATAPDQVLRYGGTNVVRLKTNLTNLGQISVDIADTSMFSSSAVTLVMLPDGVVEVSITHDSNRYGLNHITLSHGDRIVSDIFTLVLPDIEPESINLIHSFDFSGRGSGYVVAEQVIDGASVSELVKRQAITPEEAFSYARMASPNELRRVREQGSTDFSFKPLDNNDSSPNQRSASTVVQNRQKLEVRYVVPLNESNGGVSRYLDQKQFGYSAEKNLRNPWTWVLPPVIGGTVGFFAGGPVGAVYGFVAGFNSIPGGVVADAFFDSIRWDNIKLDFSTATPQQAIDFDINASALVSVARGFSGIAAGKLNNAQVPGMITNPAIDPTDILELTGSANDLIDHAQRTIGAMAQFANGAGTIGFSTDDIVFSANSWNEQSFSDGALAEVLVWIDAELTATSHAISQFDERNPLFQISGEEATAIANAYDDADSNISDLQQIISDGGGIGSGIRKALENAADPVPPQDEASVGENDSENTKFIRDAADVKAIFDSAKSIYDIAQTVEAIAANIDAIFASSGESTGNYDDLDGQTYNLYVNQQRLGTSERDIINTGEGNDNVFGYGDDDRINTSKGDDNVDAGHGRNNVLTAGGDDRITDGNGDSFLSAGAGNDTIRPSGGNDFIEGGLGHDVIIYGDPNNSGTVGPASFPLRTYDFRDIGNDILLDPSKSGEIQFRSHAFSEMRFRKDRNDLEIILPSTTGRTSNTLKFQSFFGNDAAGWMIMDSSGERRSLYELTGRITSYEVLQAVYGEPVGEESLILPSGFTTPVAPSTLSYTSNNGRFRVNVAMDDRLVNGRGLLLTFQGDSSLDEFISRNELASLAEATELLEDITVDYPFESFETVTIIGHGEGGLVAQWISAAAATRGASFVNTYLVNSPDISGLISQVSRADFPEYAAGFPHLATHYLVEPYDWASRIGIWAGNDETYATWNAYSFDFDPDAEIPIVIELSTIQGAHSPTVQASDFDSLSFHRLELSRVRGHMSLMTSDDFSTLYANRPVTIDGVEFDSTTNPREVFFDLDSQSSDPVGESVQVRTDYLTKFLPNDRSPDRSDEDPTIVEGFSLQLDFQTNEQGREHLAPDHYVVNETTLFTPGTIGQLTYGWEQLQSGVFAGQDQGRATALERDFVEVSENTFIIEVPEPGLYNVEVTVGDREIIRESLQIFANGYAVDRVSTMPGDYLTRGYQINTLDTELRLTFVDRGGRTTQSAINGITVQQVQYRDPLPVSEVLQDDPSIIVMAGSYHLPESNGFIDTYEQILKAAAIVAANAVLPGLGGAMMSMAMSLSSGQGFNLGTVFDAIGGAFATPTGSAVSLAAGIPQNFVSDPTARGILAGATSIGLGAVGARPVDPAALATSLGRSADGLVRASKELGRISSGLSAVNGALTVTNSIVQAANGNNDQPEVDLWMYDAAAALADMSQSFRLGKIDSIFDAIDPDDVIAAIQEGKSPRQLLKQWKGSRDFLVLDWLPEGLELTDVSASEHQSLVNRGARAAKQLIEAYIIGMLEEAPDAELDILFVSHGAAYDLTRETIGRLNTSDYVDALDYVKVVTLDPVSLSSTGWYHPELTSIVSSIDNIYQTENTPAGSLNHIGQALDEKTEGGASGFYNRQARIFDLQSNEEILRFRHWDTNTVELSSAELTDIEFSPDGKLVAASGIDGIVTVRYVDDVVDETTGEVTIPAGTIKVEVWGQESKVRSLAFMQMEVEGKWKDFLLTISAANDPTNDSITKNKILLTDLETGLPVWQGKDVKGTQVEASPSGNVIVSADANGKAKVWLRVGDTLTFAPLGDQSSDAIIDAHPGQDGSYIADLYVINDRFFVTAGLDDRMKLFEIKSDAIVQVDKWDFNNAGQGKVRNLDYDPYNGILAVGSGNELSLWRFDQKIERLIALKPENQPNAPIFARQDHVDSIQGVSFSKPAFLLDAEGNYSGDRNYPGTSDVIERTPDGDIDIAKLHERLNTTSIPETLRGLKLVTGGEDRTLFLYALDRLDIGDVREESVLSGSMLPIREVTLSADGRRVAVAGQDNVDDDKGGPVYDRDVTKELDSRLGWQFSEAFLRGRREHNAVPMQWVYDVVEQSGESYFWLRNANNSNRPGTIDKSRNLALPPNKRANIDEVDVAPIDLYVRPGEQIDIKPLQYLIEVDRGDYSVVQGSLTLGFVTDADGNIVGEFRQKQSGGQTLPNVLVFDANAALDYSDNSRNEYRALLSFEMIGPDDEDGVPKRVPASIDVRVINHKPVAFRDVIELHPNRAEIDFRPRANDYDFDNDDFSLVSFPTTKQNLTFNNETIATVKRTPNSINSNGTGIDIEVTVTEERLTQILTSGGIDYLPIEFEYQVREQDFHGQSTGIVEVRVALQGGPKGLAAEQVGADQFLLTWDPVAWGADKYVVERFDEDLPGGGAWVKHSSGSDVSGSQADQYLVKGLKAETDYWFRVVAKNTNSGRSHASYEGDDKEGGFKVTTPEYEKPEFVRAESLGATKIQVQWKPVYWNASEHLVQLFAPKVDAEGNFEVVGGQYQYSGEAIKNRVIDNRVEDSTVFKELSPGTPYLAVVTARNPSNNLSEFRVAEYPVFTAEKNIPNGLDLLRLGPEKIKVSWATVPFAKQYRIVAIDPHNPLDQSDRIKQSFAATSGNMNEGVLKGLDPTVDYVIIVEALDGQGNWISLLSTTAPPEVVANVPIQEGDSQFDVTLNGSSDYLLTTDFAQVLRLPSVAGLIVGTQFRVTNLSTTDIEITSFDTEQIFANSAALATYTLPAIVETELAPGETGILVYNFISTANGWQIELADNTTEALYVQTPTFLASEPGSLRLDDEASTPRRPKIVWQSPFWEVSKHQIAIALASLDPDGNVIQRNDGTFEKAGDWLQTKTKDADGSDSYTFTELDPFTNYIVRLTTWGSGYPVIEEISIRTDSQSPPSGVTVNNIDLTSFKVEWTEVAWTPENYRVLIQETDSLGNIVIGSEVIERIVSADKRSKEIAGLDTGQRYRIEVQAYSNFIKPDGSVTGWVANTPENIRYESTRALSDLNVSAFETTASRNKQIDVTWSPLNFPAETVSVAVRKKDATEWDPMLQHDVINTANTSKTIVELDRNQEYELQLRVGVTVQIDGEQSMQYVYSEVITGATSWGISAIDQATVNSVRVQFPRIADATRYEIRYYLPGDPPIFVDVKEDISQGPANPRYTTIEGLDQATEYEFVAVAFIGQAELLSEAFVGSTVTPRPAQMVEAPENEIGRRNFLVTWVHPEESKTYGFHVRASKDGGVTWLNVKNSSGTDGLGLPKEQKQFRIAEIQRSVGSGQYDSLDMETEYFVQITTRYDNGSLRVDLPAPLSVTTKGRYAPEGVIVEKITPTSVRVSWDHDGDGVDFFRIEKRQPGGSWNTAKGGLENFENSFTLTNAETKLVPGTEYKFRVIAVYPADDLISPVVAQTLDPATRPSNVRETSRLHTELTVAWDAPSPYWDINNYEVLLKRTGFATQSVVVPAAALRTATFSGLTADANYTVEVLAKNSSLDNTVAASDVLTIRTAAYQKPTQPTFSGVSYTTVTLIWTHSDPVASPTAFKIYRNGQEIVQLSGSARTYTNKALQPGVNYSYVVSAMYGHQAASSDPRSITTPSASVSTPTVAKGQWREVVVTWTKPSWEPLSYIIYLHEANSPIVWTFVFPSASQSVFTHVFIDLDPNKTYMARINAVRTTIDGSINVFSSFSSTTSPISVAAPTITNVWESGGAASDRTISFSWTHSLPPGMATSDIKYRLERRGGDGEWKGVVGNIAYGGSASQSSSVKRQNSNSPLNRNTAYDFRIVALYKIGSEWLEVLGTVLKPLTLS